MGKKGGRKSKKGKPATSATSDPPVGDTVAAETELKDEDTSSRPSSPSASEPRTDEPSIPPSPLAAAEPSTSTVKAVDLIEPEEKVAPAALPPDHEHITTGLGGVNLESEQGDIGMPQEEVVPVGASVHAVEAEHLEPEGQKGIPEPSQQEPLVGEDMGEPELAADTTTSERSPEVVSHPSTGPLRSAITEETTPAHATPEDLGDFDEVDIGASSQSPAEVIPPAIDRPTEADPAEEAASAHPESKIDVISESSGNARNAETVDALDALSRAPEQRDDETGTGGEDSGDVPPFSIPHTTHESEESSRSGDQVSGGAVPHVHVDAGTPVSSSDSKPTSALGSAFESPTSIAQRRQLPPLSVAASTPSHSSTPSADAPQISPMIRSTSLSSSRVGIISPRSAKSSPRVFMSPKFRSIDAAYSDDEDDGMEDMPMEGAPFESIPLDADGEVATSLSRTGSKTHSRQASKDSNGPRSTTNGHPKVDLHGVPITDRPKTPTSRAVTPRESPGDGRSVRSQTHSPRGASPKVNPVPANANQHTTQALGVKGVNAFEKFVSRTRPAHLPPKDKSEDMEHLHQWESMMAQAKQHDAEERKKQQQRQQQREKRLMDVTPRWEALLNAKDFSPAKVQANPSNRKLWFEGCPPRLRGKAWQLAIGNPLTMHKDAFKMYLKRSRRALDQGRFPADILEQLESDLDHTLNTLHIFQRGSPMRDELRELICAWVVYRSDEALGYAPYINLLAAMFLLVMPIDQAFFSLCNFLSRPVMRAFYSDTKDEIAAFYRVFENLQADTFPRIFANCKNLGLSLPESYFRSVLVEQVPFECALRLWDQIMLDGDGYIFRANLAIFGFLEPRLYYPDRDEIRSVLEGHNKASMLIQERERERAKLRGEVYDHHVDGSLSVFGLTEEPLFEWLENDRWQESRFERLAVRELPD